MPRVLGQNLLAPYPRRSLPPLDLAVMLRTTRRGQLHTGVVTLQDNSLIVLHLGWHNRLYQNKVGSDDMLAIVAPVPTHVPPMRRSAIASLCRRVWTKYANGGLPYAFTEGSQLSGQGTSNLAPPHHFTCATFVLALFAAAGYPLTRGQWPAPSRRHTTSPSTVRPTRHTGPRPFSPTSRPPKLPRRAFAATPSYPEVPPKALRPHSELPRRASEGTSASLRAPGMPHQRPRAPLGVRSDTLDTGGVTRAPGVSPSSPRTSPPPTRPIKTLSP